MSNIQDLNNKLKLINNQFKLSNPHPNNNATSPMLQTHIQEEERQNNKEKQNIKDLINDEILKSNKSNDKFNSLLTDNSIYVNNPYYSKVNNFFSQNTNTNTSKYETLNNEKNKFNFDLNNKPSNQDMNDMTDIRNLDNEANSRLNNFQFQNYNLKPNETANKLSPFDDRSKDKYVKKKNIGINPNSEVYSPLGRAIATPHNIQFDINENLLNRNKNKITVKDIANERLNEFSPLARASHFPTKKNSVPNKTDEMKKFLDSYNTHKQSCIKTNYKEKAKITNYNNINPTYVSEDIIAPNPENTRLI